MEDKTLTEAPVAEAAAAAAPEAAAAVPAQPPKKSGRGGRRPGAGRPRGSGKKKPAPVPAPVLEEEEPDPDPEQLELEAEAEIENAADPEGRGGRRRGAGRKKGSGMNLTDNIQVCVSADQKKVFRAMGGTRWIRRLIDEEMKKVPPGAVRYSRSDIRLRIKLMESSVQAGFPTPAEPGVEDTLDPATLLVEHPEATYFVHASGESMIDAGIFPGDLLVVDRAVEPRSGDIVIARIDNEYTVKRFYQKGDVLELRPENSSGAFTPLVPQEGSEWYIEGVVTHTLRDFRRRR